MKLSIVIPVFNEAPTLAKLLESVWNAPLPQGISREMLIVDNRSTDGSLEIASQFEREHRATETHSVKVLRCPDPGKGRAVQTGFAQASGDILLIQDADLEYDTADYPQLLQPIIDGKTKLVLGSRHLSAGSWKIRQFENRPVRVLFLNFGGLLFHGLFNLLFGVRLTDPTTMYKIFRRECLEGLNFRSNRFDFDFELLGRLILKGYAPYEVPVSYRSRDFKDGKKVHVLRDPLTWLWAIFRVRFTA